MIKAQPHAHFRTFVLASETAGAILTTPASRDGMLTVTTI